MPELDGVLGSSFEVGKDAMMMTLSSPFLAAELTFESERALELALQLFRKGSAVFADGLHDELATQAGADMPQSVNDGFDACLAASGCMAACACSRD